MCRRSGSGGRLGDMLAKGARPEPHDRKLRKANDGADVPQRDWSVTSKSVKVRKVHDRLRQGHGLEARARGGWGQRAVRVWVGFSDSKLH